MMRQIAPDPRDKPQRQKASPAAPAFLATLYSCPAAASSALRESNSIKDVSVVKLSTKHSPELCPAALNGGRSMSWHMAPCVNTCGWQR